jgi:hypothetical protein
MFMTFISGFLVHHGAGIAQLNSDSLSLTLVQVCNIPIKLSNEGQNVCF